jgi:hypothetical protein
MGNESYSVGEEALPEVQNYQAQGTGARYL